MDKRTKRIIASGAAALGLAAVGTAAYKNDEKLFAMGIRRSFGKNDVRRDAGLKAPEDVVRVTDLAYAAGDGASHAAGARGLTRPRAPGLPSHFLLLTYHPPCLVDIFSFFFYSFYIIDGFL